MVTAKPLPELEKFGMKAAPDAGEPAERQPVSAWLPIRTLQARHRRQILDHLMQLDEHDRYLRFGSTTPVDQLIRYTAAIDFRRDEVFGVFNHRLQLVAMAHLAALPDGSSPAGRGVPAMEFAVSVLPHGRGRGLGQRLFEHAVMHARNHGARALVINALTENRPMLRIALRAGAQLQTEGRDAEAWLTLPRDTLATHLESSVHAWRAETWYRIKARVLALKDWLASVVPS